ncbi:peroxidase 40-like [Dorcoceras hygrometricum]|uniref:Peroxidase n=1 Tax=Dorcoceras hygrometricum TaxID=472368 RepID=A0A2Z6ZZG2_9LAMI|nr:peroxidase 40-like [Dorcoceras hygrometricum]
MILFKFPVAFCSTSDETLNKDCIDGATASIVLTFGFYQSSCPEAEPTIFSWVEKAVSDEPRMAASLLRLHFHDCFVNARSFGCDASVLLDDMPNFVGEKTAAPNFNSLRGFEVIDAIKADLEYVCPQTVSCSDILAVAARDSVVLVSIYITGGPGWDVQMGRKDSLSASLTEANNNIPAPNSDVHTLLSKFQNVGLSLQDMVALSGAHTMGKARCFTFNGRISSGSNGPDVNLEFLQSLQQLCSGSDANATLADLDHMTPSTFDNEYYVNLLSGEGLLGSDQALVTGSVDTQQLVESYVDDMGAFFEDFKSAMLKMGSLASSENDGEIRRNCRIVNQFNK